MSTIDLMNDATLQTINANLKECNIYLKNISEGKTFSPTDIQTISDISKSGLAKRYFHEGDQIVVTYTSTSGTQYSMPWDMYLGKSATLADGTTREGIYLQSHYVTPEPIAFDAPEIEVATEPTATAGLYYYGFDGTNYTLLSLNTGDTVPYGSYTAVYHNEIKDSTANICKDGYNRSSHSAAAQWLNSAALKNAWWTAKHIGDCAPVHLGTYNGFLAGMPTDFINAIETIKVPRLLNTISEPDKNIASETFNAKFFLPSLEQMYITPQVAGVEGDAWEYYKALALAASLPGKFAQGGTYTPLISYALENNSSAQNVRLGSATRGNSYSTWNISTSGNVDSHSARYMFRCRPACFI